MTDAGIKASKVASAFMVLCIGSVFLLKDLPGKNASMRRELRSINKKNINTGNQNDPRPGQKEIAGARNLKAATLPENSPGDRDGRKLSIDETKEILLEILNGPEGFRVLKRIASKMDEDVDGDAEGGAEQSRRLGHHLTVHFPDCVLSGEAECKEAILADLESSPDLYAHIGGYVEFETRKKRSPNPNDPDHDKVVLVTDSTGTKVIGLNGDCIGKFR